MLPTESNAARSYRLDESNLQIEAKNERTTKGTWHYALKIQARVFGDVEHGDVLKFKVKKGKKEVASLRCTTTLWNFDKGASIHHPHVSTKRCTSGDASITAHGNLTVEAVYVRDADESTHPLRTYTITVLKYHRVENIDWRKKKATRSFQYQVAPLDQMGLGYAFFKAQKRGADFGEVNFYFWTPASKHFPNTDFRCTRGGETVVRIPKVRWRAIESIDQRNEQFVKERTATEMNWKKVVVWTQRHIAFGTGNDSSWNKPVFTLTPGDYACKFRADGETIRQFRFSIGADHKMVQHPIQKSGTVVMGPNRFLVDTRFPKHSKYERCFPGKEIKKSVWFGRAWPASSKDALKALPPSFGKVQAP